jgi:hypothetical protein
MTTRTALILKANDPEARATGWKDALAAIRAAARVDGPCTLTYEQVSDLQQMMVDMLAVLDSYRDRLAASPRAGRVGLDVLEMAAADAYAVLMAGRTADWTDMGPLWVSAIRAAFVSAGLAVEEAAS